MTIKEIQDLQQLIGIEARFHPHMHLFAGRCILALQELINLKESAVPEFSYPTALDIVDGYWNEETGVYERD